ncbi:hypothetical protein SCHPADRAFT_1003102 [Schizopora paradoxa]|uniref:Uncharacterized protein n=1 Tax=Schizopora paradoxa TaxID=27342 RepID=A0A0H2R021_9AGAM|nr:hypothetical protein SCHPADRAFT_1003102 [Schizopora paradoxa]
MPFNVASIKDKASHVKTASVTKFQDTRDKYSSAPMAKSKFAEDGISPAHKPPPPPLPPSRAFNSSVRSTSSSSDSSAPPPVLKSSRPKPSFSSTSHSDAHSDEIDRIDWQNLSPEDKEEFFGWLDEFFSQYLGRQIGPERSSVGAHQSHEASPIDQNHGLRPPPIKTWSKPTLQR